MVVGSEALQIYSGFERFLRVAMEARTVVQVLQWITSETHGKGLHGMTYPRSSKPGSLPRYLTKNGRPLALCCFLLKDGQMESLTSHAPTLALLSDR